MNDKRPPPPRGPGPGPGERTIVRPNPGGRRPVAAPPAAPAAPAGIQVPPASAAPAQPSTEEWISTPAAAPRQDLPPASRDFRVEELVAPNENPILRAAGPLLLLLGRLRVAALRASFASLMEEVAEAIGFFEKDIRSAGISENQANTAKYILCATADDIVQNIPTEDRHVWTQYSMLSRFFGERIGGVRFFEELDRAKQDPLVNYPLLELMHTCLALGFQGIHRTSGGGQVALQQIQRNLYETLRRVRPKVQRDLSPHWRGQNLPSRALRVQIPLWAVAGVVGVLLFGLFITLRTLLSGGAEATVQALANANPDGKLSIFRRVPTPPPPPPPPPPPDRITQLQRIRAALAAEIAGGKLSVDQTANQIYIRVGDVVLFAVGQADVLDQFKPIAARVAATLEKENGFIKIVGHTDSTPIRTVRFASNWELSMERAKSVAAILKPGISKPDRIQVDGKGADVPIAPNTTPEGRTKNRRVEIFIPRTD
jgi:type VI secretion system protein ImpK